MRFVIVYDRVAAKIVNKVVFADDAFEEAAAVRWSEERRYRDRGDEIEVVTLVAEDEAALHRTHARYFYTVRELLEAFPR